MEKKADQITVTFVPREGIYVYAVNTPSGQKPSWNNGKASLEATQERLEKRYPNAVFTHQN